METADRPATVHLGSMGAGKKLIATTGSVNGVTGRILIDCGATMNFVSRRWTTQHAKQLPTTVGQRYKVKLADRSNSVTTQ